MNEITLAVSQEAFDLRKKSGGFWFEPRFIHGETLPHRLEPRASVIAYMVGPADQHPLLREALRARVRTACGHEFTGANPAFRRYIEQLRPARKRAEKPTRRTRHETTEHPPSPDRLDAPDQQAY
jgi:hypothetical protein